MPALDQDARHTAKALPQQARALRTRERLIEAGRNAFAKFGVDGANLADDILGPAGVSVGSFYHQFADKTELLLAIISDGVDARYGLVVDQGLSEEHSSLEDMISAGFRRFFESLDSDRFVWRIQMAEQNNPDPRVHALALNGRQRWVQLIAAALRPWTDADDDAVVSAATLLMTLATGTANVYLGMSDDHRQTHRTSTLETTVRFSTAGLGPILGSHR